MTSLTTLELGLWGTARHYSFRDYGFTELID